MQLIILIKKMLFYQSYSFSGKFLMPLKVKINKILAPWLLLLFANSARFQTNNKCWITTPYLFKKSSNFINAESYCASFGEEFAFFSNINYYLNVRKKIHAFFETNNRKYF